MKEHYSADNIIREMANLRPELTGLPKPIYISSREGRHGPRIKVYLEKIGSDQPNAVFQINQDSNERPQWLAGDALDSRSVWAVQTWIDLNRQLLLKMWYEGAEIYSDEWEALKGSLLKVSAEQIADYKRRFLGSQPESYVSHYLSID